MNDLIYRQDAIDAVCKDNCEGRDGCRFYPNCSNLITLQTMPSAQPDADMIHLQKEQAYMQGYEDGKKAQRTGKWIQSYVNDVPHKRCDQCGALIEETFFAYEYDVNYCPSCGAMMQKGEPMDDLISRRAAIDIYDDYNIAVENGELEAYGRYRKQLCNLPSAQPEQTNCDYCHEDQDGYVVPLDKNAHACIYRGKLSLRANGWHGSTKIRYCPMCGRALKNDK